MASQSLPDLMSMRNIPKHGSSIAVTIREQVTVHVRPTRTAPNAPRPAGAGTLIVREPFRWRPRAPGWPTGWSCQERFGTAEVDTRACRFGEARTLGRAQVWRQLRGYKR